MNIYLDYNASNPVDERVIEEMMNIYRNFYGNSDSRTHNYGISAKICVEKARSQLADLLHAEKEEIVFTSGATESNNLAILGMAQYGKENKKKHIITTSIEHKAVLEPIKYLSKSGFDVEFITPETNGRVDPNKILSRIRPDTLLVSVMHVNNETGIIQPVLEIGEEISKLDTFFHIDAAQSCGKIVDELRKIKYDMLSITAHKMYGPQGIGALVLKRKNYKRPPIKPITFGGGHEGGIRSGTLPVALIAGFGLAAQIADSEYNENAGKNLNIRKEIINQLDLAKVNYQINGSLKYCIPNTLNISFIGVDSEALMLTVKDICAISNGSACNSNAYTPSHVLTAMGLSQERIESAVRLSWGTTHNNIVNIDDIIINVKALAIS